MNDDPERHYKIQNRGRKHVVIYDLRRAPPDDIVHVTDTLPEAKKWVTANAIE